ncbi:MAG: PRC-barrel domain containing protein [Desulfobacteraceae bacterium]|nr:MAG: PRC-barrel domain containing protein [Desulfobacteraceae bacterium]
MLNKAKTLKGYRLDGRDGEMGKVREFYFDDRYWTIRYLVVDTGTWLRERQVLISPYALGAVNKEEELIAVDLTKKQIEDSPTLDSDKPVSRQFEERYHGYYGWPLYWSGPHRWGFFPSIERNPKEWKKTIESEKAWDPHLRSTLGVSGHHIQAVDGEIGHVEDFIVDDGMWAIRYLIVDTRNGWLGGKKVLISPRWIERVSWNELKVFVNLSREAVKQSPEYTEESLPTRDYETKLHRHYNRQEYCFDEPVVGEHYR